ncbi:DUF6438 domain-containing protein [Mucilaginibacter sp. OK283]|jgi:hypothetical protein|uniref:DUF6438 domain-containing protein n=1 Tax=Mucilaginibacter sp. OK283 TaxID=1881049 RepID=UPI0008CDA7AF|nr:DUF6438 domain-containing protein [Mucilaginibacter sp. OK283]SEP13156.1 hypothetical protein SAMN05428947_10791 [Mucilaginibacter sp. OK283]
MIKHGFLLFAFIIVFGELHAQKVQLDSIRWINKDLGHLYFENGRVNFNFIGNDKFKSHYSIVKDTLIMTDIYTSSVDNFKVKHKINFKFLIRDLTKNRLYIKAVDSNAIKLAGPDTYEFTNLKNSYDKDIKLSAVRFLSSTCHGDCPQLEILIGADGDYHLRGGEYADPFKGEFTGKLSKPQLDTLNYWLKHSELKKMYNWRQQDQVIDMPNYYFEFDFENNKKKLSVTTNQPPLNMTGLVEFMLSSYKKVKLTPVK